MNVFKTGKIVWAIVGALVIIIGVGFLAKIIYTSSESNGSNYASSVPESQDTGTSGTSLKTPADADTASLATNTTSEAAQTASVPATSTDTNQAATTTAKPAKATAITLADASSGSGGASAFSVLLASASADKGKQIARKCAACHDLSKGGRNKYGPALYGVVGTPVGANATYKYSTALKAMAVKGDIWTYAALDAFLAKPRDFAPGTKMSFSLRKEKDRADLLAYLRTLSASPVALP